MEWSDKWPEKPGWYWVYQELENGYGTYCSLYLIENNGHIPLYAKAFYGPMEAPDMPDDFVSEFYKKNKK